MIDQVRKLLFGLQGNKVVRVLVGPAGVHYDFGREQESADAFVQYGLLSNTSVTIHSSQRERLLDIAAFPPFSCQSELQRLLLGKIVTEADLDEKRNAVRIILEENLLLSLVPTVIQESEYWAIYHWPSGSTAGKLSDGFVVTTNSIERVRNLET